MITQQRYFVYSGRFLCGLKPVSFFFFLIVSVSRSKKIRERSRGHLLKSRDKQQDMQKERALELGS